jgi:hypothetical protein
LAKQARGDHGETNYLSARTNSVLDRYYAQSHTFHTG